MSVNIDNNEFYISLLSNSSLSFYPDNVQGRFRNILPRLCNLTDTWCVGISELALPAQKIRKKRFTSEANKVSGKKRVRRDYPKEGIAGGEPLALRIVLNFEDFHGSLNWTQKQLSEISNGDGTIDFSTFLSSFFSRIEPAELRSLGVGRAKEKMWARVEADLVHGVIVGSSYEKLPNEFILNIKQNDAVVEKVVLKNYTYPSIESFTDVIIGQIPKERRNRNSLQSLIVLGSSLPAPPKFPDEMKSIDTLELQWPGVGIQLKIKKPLPLRSKFRDFMKTLLAGIHFNDGKLSDEERKNEIQLFKMLLLAHIEKLKQNSLDTDPVKWRKSEIDSTIVEAPYEKESGGDYKTIQIAVDTETDNLRDFFTDFFLQIPKNKRNTDAIISEIKESFDSLGSKKDGNDDAAVWGKFEILEKNIHRMIEKLGHEASPISEKIHEEYTMIINSINSLSKTVSELTGKIDKKSSDHGEDFNKKLSMMLDKIRNLEEEVSEVSKDSSSESITSPSEYNDGELIFISSGVIRPRIIGNRLVRCLRVIPSEECGRMLRFEHIEYHPIESTFIESIAIEVTKQQGEIVAFHSSDVPTYLTLHFKRR